MSWTGLELGRGVVENISGLVSGLHTNSLCSYNNIECNRISAVALKLGGAVSHSHVIHMVVDIHSGYLFGL